MNLLIIFLFLLFQSIHSLTVTNSNKLLFKDNSTGIEIDLTFDALANIETNLLTEEDSSVRSFHQYLY